MSPEQLYRDLIDAVHDAEHVPCQSSPHLWMPDDEQNAESMRRMAKRACLECPVKDLCLSYAIAADEEHGVWGGTGRSERRSMRQSLRLPSASA